jgi:gas vesicle protein
MEYNNKKGKLGAFLSGVVMATAIGGYMLFGSKKSRRNRQKVEDWMEDAKAEVVTRLKKIKKLSRDKYDEIIDTVSDKYAELKEVGKEKADTLRDELKSRWDEVKREAEEEAEE